MIHSRNNYHIPISAACLQVLGLALENVSISSFCGNLIASHLAIVYFFLDESFPVILLSIISHDQGFTKLVDVLPQDPVNFQSDMITITSNYAASRIEA